MSVAGIALWSCGLWGGVGRLAGFVLCVLFAAYTVLLIRNTRKQRQRFLADSVELVGELHPELARSSLGREILWLLVGAAGISLCSYLIVGSGVAIASSLGVPELVISLTVIALGTSLPELMTAIVAVMKGHNDLSLGNVIGANILDLLLIPGLCAMVRPLPLNPKTLFFDMPVLVLLMVLCVAFGLTHRRLERWEGGTILVVYLVYVSLRWAVLR